MKKVCLILVSVILLIVLAVPAMAADVTLTATASATTVQAGDEITITISTAGTTPITALGMFLEYDTSIFEFKSSSWCVGIIDANTKNFDASSGKLTAVWNNAGAYTGEMIKVTLTVKSVKPGNTSIKFGDLSCKNVDSDVSVAGVPVQISLVCNHSYPATWTKVDGEYHEKICSKCQTQDEQKHTWDEGELIKPPSCTDDGEEKYTCLDGCGATKTEKIKALGHSWDNACDPTCNRKDCGYTRETEHEYSASWKSDATGHWHECIKKCGSKSDFAAHTPGPEATAEAAQLCTVCKYEITPKVVHEHQFSTEWVSDSEGHWHRCMVNDPICIVKDAAAPHDYSDACDIDCNTCGYIRVAPHSYSGEWQASANGHWGVCTICNTRSDVLPHIPGAEATEDTPQTCSECNFIIKMELSHVHDFGEVWYGDDTNHWQSCSDSKCPEVQSMEPHTWDEGEELPEGGFLYTCSICAKQVTLAEPMPSEPVTEPSTGTTTQPGTTQKPAEKEPKDAISWEWAGIAAIVLLIIGVGLLVFEFFRSRKTNMKGKYSK